MPTERFRRLPEEKKQIIYDAAMKEFARVPFEQVSINQIVHNAGISRGSFYTYFEDKKDVVEFLFEELSRELHAYSVGILEKNGGDFFNLLEAMFNYLVGEFQKTNEMFDIAKNLFSYQENVDAIGLSGFFDPYEEKKCQSSPVRLYERLDKSRLRASTREEFMPVLTLGTMTLMVSVKRYYEHPDKLEETRNLFRKTLEVLKHGALIC